MNPICPTYRPNVFDACLDALDLGPHRQTAERLLLRDHPDHLAVVLETIVRKRGVSIALGAIGGRCGRESACPRSS
jgi:hypothetical protein